MLKKQGRQGCQEPAQDARMAQHSCCRGFICCRGCGWQTRGLSVMCEACGFLPGVVRPAGRCSCKSSLVRTHAGQAPKQMTTLIRLVGCTPCPVVLHRPACLQSGAALVAVCTLLHLSCDLGVCGSRPASWAPSKQPNPPRACVDQHPTHPAGGAEPNPQQGQHNRVRGASYSRQAAAARPIGRAPWLRCPVLIRTSCMHGHLPGRCAQASAQVRGMHRVSGCTHACVANTIVRGCVRASLVCEAGGHTHLHRLYLPPAGVRQTHTPRGGQMPNVLQSRGSSSRLPHAQGTRMMVNSSVLCVPPAQPLMPAPSTMCSSLLFSLDVSPRPPRGREGSRAFHPAIPEYPVQPRMPRCSRRPAPVLTPFHGCVHRWRRRATASRQARTASSIATHSSTASICASRTWEAARWVCGSSSEASRGGAVIGNAKHAPSISWGSVRLHSPGLHAPRQQCWSNCG